MSLIEIYGPHLPHLRRFARAISGSQPIGDALVKSTLTALSSDTHKKDNSLSAKVFLYQLFLKVWEQEYHDKAADADGGEDGSPLSRIKALPSRPRQAFLLSALDSFSLSDIGSIMGVDATAARELLDQAEKDIQAELRTNVMIIEDEPLISADLESLLEELGHSVDGVATTHTEAVALAKAKKPSLVLADLQLADGSSGADAVKDIIKDYDVPVIFITGVPEKLLTGEKVEPAYLISKPFERSNVKAAISQALFFR